MSLVPMRQILDEAEKGDYGVGAYNVNNMEQLQAIMWAADETKSPVILQVSKTALKYTDKKLLVAMVNVVADTYKDIPVSLHLDHGPSLELVKEVIDLGFTSVMIDASRMTLEENIAITKEVVEYAHPKGVAVQAELGKVPYLGSEQLDIDWNEIMTDPDEAKKMVKETGVDALAVAIGNAHGFFREKSEPDFNRLAKIRAKLPNTPLILHGASDWVNGKVVKAIEGGICAFNIDTDTRIAFCSAICKVAGDKHCEVNDPRKFLKVARDDVQKAVERKIRMFAVK